MTVQEAIDWLKAISVTLQENIHKSSYLKRKEAVHMGIQALRELEQYKALGTPKEIKIREVSSAQLGKAYLSNLTELREYQSLGTVEELKESREKQIPKRVDIKKDMWGFEEYYCPHCQTKFFCNIAGYTIKEAIGEFEQCFRCGQALKWGEEDD